MKSVFNPSDVNEIINRISKLNSNSTPLWGKMNVSQMLAHCNVTYEMIYETIHPEPNFIFKFILKAFVKKKVVTEAPYPKHSPTAPQFIIKGDKDFGVEKNRLVSYIERALKDGPAFFDGRNSHSFGKLNTTEWNCMMYKHLDHHLNQFGV